jgi:hypothetical protein
MIVWFLQATSQGRGTKKHSCIKVFEVNPTLKNCIMTDKYQGIKNEIFKLILELWNSSFWWSDIAIVLWGGYQSSWPDGYEKWVSGAPWERRYDVFI